MYMPIILDIITNVLDASMTVKTKELLDSLFRDYDRMSAYRIRRKRTVGLNLLCTHMAQIVKKQCRVNRNEPHWKPTHLRHTFNKFGSEFHSSILGFTSYFAQSLSVNI